MKAFILFLIIFLSSLGSVFSQKILILDLTGMRSKRIKYISGDYMAIKVIDDKTTYKGFIDIISDSSFYISGNLVMLDSIRAIVKHNRVPKTISKQAFLVAGITAVISGLNNALTKGSVFPDDDSYFVPAVFAGIGVVLLPFWKKTYRLNDKRFVKIIDISPSLPMDAGP